MQVDSTTEHAAHRVLIPFPFWILSGQKPLYVYILMGMNFVDSSSPLLYWFVVCIIGDQKKKIFSRQSVVYTLLLVEVGIIVDQKIILSRQKPLYCEFTERIPLHQV